MTLFIDRNKVYRKPTHAQTSTSCFDSHRPLEHKLGVIQILEDQAKNVPSSTEGKQKELTHIKKALQTCCYPKWTFVKSSKRRHKEKPKTERGGKMEEHFYSIYGKSISKIQ